ncbi:phage terminase large subunit [Candidatus Micrarchaeota archaeon]|jgi:phage terminase large subunit|nr:phage terminase large subunit [Candidatus Micrarchaeota archaeon]
MYSETTATAKIAKLKSRIRAVSGGTGASKTVSILIWLIGYAQTVDNELISIVSESFPHLKRGVMRDFLSIMETHNYFKAERWNKTDYTYTFETGSKIEFFSADQPGKVRGPRRDVLFINEANNIPFETYTQLDIRTKKIILMDWNPVSEFWFYTELQPNKELEIDFITLTYKDNEALDESIVQAIESRRSNKRFWQVYGLGQLGEAEGRIYTDWAIIDEIPHEARLTRYGLDFGYSNDPSAILAIYEYNGGFIIDEITYRKGLHNKQLADIFKNLDHALVIADSAEPKSIDEISSYGISILPSKKGKDSVSQGIQYVQNQRISLTKRSINTIKEYRNYLWEIDKDGKMLNTPEGGFDHSMDALRYAINSMVKQETQPIMSINPTKWQIA